ncbi:MAG: dehydrogenase [Azospirillum brasilense]|nr:MAG: dehydrogenase [Azospirillum brasilense]
MTITRRAALLAATGMLAGCETLDDIFASRKDILPGERRSVLEMEKPVSVDEGLAARPVDLPPPGAIAAWPQAGGTLDHSPGHAALSLDGLRQAWSGSVGSGSAFRRRMTSGPIASADTVFASDAFGVVSAWDLARGGRRWRFDTRPEDDDVGALGVGCAFDGGTLYIATGMAEVIALDAGNGTLRWRTRLSAPMRGAPTVAEGRIFVLTLDNQLNALSAEDGHKLWSFQGQQVSAVPLGLAAPAVEGDTLVAGFPSGELVALRTADGRVVWTEALSAAPGVDRGIADIAGVHALPVISDGRVIALGMGGTTMVVDLRSGRRLWERNVGGGVTPAVAGEWIFLVSATQRLVAMTRDTGQVRWITELNPSAAPGDKKAPEPARFAAPLLANGQLLVPGSGGQALIVGANDGAVAGRVPLPGPVTLAPATAGGAVLVLSDDGTLAALRG